MKVQTLFYGGLKILLTKLENFKSDTIRKTATEYTWSNIVLNNLRNYLFDIVR